MTKILSYVTVMGLPRDLIRTIGHLKTTSALAPLSMPAGLIGVFAVLMTIVGGPHHPLTWTLWIFFMIWLVAIFGAYIFWSIKSPAFTNTCARLNTSALSLTRCARWSKSYGPNWHTSYRPRGRRAKKRYEATTRRWRTLLIRRFRSAGIMTLSPTMRGV
jgi:hypothetical protein